MPTTISSGSDLDPNVGLSAYIRAWKDQQQQQAADLANLAAAIITLRNMLASGNVQGAFLFAGMVVMTQSMACVGDNTGQFAAVENLGTGIRNIVGDLQNIFNEGNQIDSSTDPSGSKNFATWLNEFYGTLAGGCPSWMNSNDYQNVMNSVNSLYTEFGGKPGAMNGSTVYNKMKAMFPQTQKTAPDQAVTALHGDFQTLNNSVSAISSSATASEQYWANVYNQAQGVVNNIFQSIGSFNTNSIANQRSN